MHIYILSLKSSIERRNSIKQQLQRLNISWDFVDGIDGRTEKIKNLSQSKLANTEVACSLGHVKIYNSIVKSNHKHAIILEDDVFLIDQFQLILSKLIDFVENNLNNELIILGGQEGLSSHKRYFVGGQKHNICENYYLEKSFYSSKYLFRTCCYMLTKEVASKLLNVNVTGKFRADDWNYYEKLQCFDGLYILKPSIVIHPLELKSSLIEGNRVEIAKKKYLVLRIVNMIKLKIIKYAKIIFKNFYCLIK